MATPLAPPPKKDAAGQLWDQWIQSVWRKLKGQNLVVETSGDAAADISSGVEYHGVTALTNVRTLTLPAASDLDDGRVIVVQDESGAAGSHTITVQKQGSDTVNGTTSATITTNYGRLTVIKRGTGKYFAK